MKRLLLLLLVLSLGAHAQTTIFTSDFDGNTGAVVLPGNTDNTSGSASLGVTWTQHASVTGISGLTAISTGDSGTSGGFARLQNGTATYANDSNVYISRNHNLDTNRATSKRGYSFTFTIDDSWDLTTLTVLSGHTNNTGLQDQDLVSKLNLSISGGTLGSPITANSTEDYIGSTPAYHTVNFNLGGDTLGAGTYTVEVWQSDMTGGGAYAMYDGITLTGEQVTSTISVIDFGLPGTTSMVGTINQFATQQNTAETAANMVLNTTAGADSGIRFTTSGGVFSAGGPGTFSPAGSTAYTGGSAVIDGWIANEQVAFGDIWQGTANGTPQTVSMTFSSLAANASYTFKLLSGRANDFGAANGSYTMNYDGGGNLAGGGTHNSEGSAAGLGATNYTWTFVTGATPGDAVINLSGAWNANALIITQSTNPAAPTIGSFTVNDQYVTPGSAVTFSWVTDGATTLTLNPGNIDLLPFSTDGDGSSNPITVNATTTYTLTATNAAGSATAEVDVTTGPARPNILFFLVDDMGANDTSEPFQVDGAGNDVPSIPNGIYHTPNMAALALQGMKFTRAYAMPVCTPTRNSFMIGQNSARHHVTTWTGISLNEETGQNSTPSHNSPLNWRRTGLDTSTPSLAKILSDAGYRSIHVGKAHFGNASDNIDPLDIGFDVNIGGKQTGRPGSYYGTSNFGSGTYQVPHLEAYHGQNIFLTEVLTLEMNKEIEKAVNAGVPFFAYMSHYAVHDPYDTDARFSGNPKYAGLSGNNLAFATLIEGMDKSLGDIRTKLATLGVAEDTLVIFVSDNGSTLPLGSDPLRGYKGQKYEGGTRVPMIAAWSSPNPSNTFQSQLNIPADSYEDDIVSCFDLFPTILGVANVSHSNTIDGYDLREYFKGTAGTHRPQELVIHFPHDHNGAWGDYYTVYHEGDYKLIYNFASDSYELYNVITDIHEDTNLATGDPNRVMAMARKMAQQLNAHGAQWPTFDTSPTDTDDPYAMPVLPGIDLDDDGIDDNAEDPDFNGLQDAGETDPDNPDSDQDGTLDGAEVKLGLDPLDGSQRFDLRPSQLPNGDLQIVWPSAPGNLFTISASTDLDDWSDIIASGVPASGGTTTSYNLGPPGPAFRFYRVRLE